MNGKGKPLSQSGIAFFMIVVCALAVLGCFLLYEYDNKYNTDGPQAREGVLFLDKTDLSQYPVVFLVEGWEYYGGRLLAPEDFVENAPVPDAYIYIGQYGGFEEGDVSSSPHGSATYRLRIEIPDEPQAYLLELPEIFSAYRLYVNGEETAAMGNPDLQNYRAETGNRTVSIEAGGEIELLFAVSDFSHHYSGMVYPPAFGQPQAVSSLLDARLVFRSLLATFALAVSIFSILIGFLNRKKSINLLYGLLCLCFVGFTSYPILRTLFSIPVGFYAVEMAALCAMLVVVMLLQRLLYVNTRRWEYCFIGFGLAMCTFSALLPLLLPGGNLHVMAAYATLFSLYELITAAYITISSIRAFLHAKPYSAILLCGFLVFDVALVMDRILPLYEPIVTGWFYELSSFVLILCIGAAVGSETAAKHRENMILTDRQASMEKLARMQKDNYKLLMEKVEEAKTARHDLRHHFRMIGGFSQNGEYDKLNEYIEEYSVNMDEGAPIGYTCNIVADVLLRHYARISKQHTIDFAVRAELEQEIGVSDADLCAAISNLLENAVEACSRMTSGERFISIILTQQKNALSIFMENSADRIGRQQENGFSSQKADGREGYGLKSIIAIAKRYGGETQFSYDDRAGVFTSAVLLNMQRKMEG